MGSPSIIHPHPTNPVLAGLVRSIEALHRSTRNPRRLSQGAASTLRLFLGHPGLLAPEQRASDPETYRQHILHVAADRSFSIVAMVWRAGQSTSVHDHVSWAAVGIHEGREQETGYEIVNRGGLIGLVPTRQEILSAGSSVALQPPGDIHEVSNPGPGEAISIHIYGADVGQLGSSIRQRYDLPILAPPVTLPAARQASGL
jgi:predicted metal-dependent enzyme (double-stranded beta helix superfamily)